LKHTPTRTQRAGAGAIATIAILELTRKGNAESAMEEAWKRTRTPIQPAGATGIASVAIPDPKPPTNAQSVMKAEAVCWSIRIPGRRFTITSATQLTASSATHRKATHRGSPELPATHSKNSPHFI